MSVLKGPAILWAVAITIALLPACAPKGPDGQPSPEVVAKAEKAEVKEANSYPSLTILSAKFLKRLNATSRSPIYVQGGRMLKPESLRSREAFCGFASGKRPIELNRPYAIDPQALRQTVRGSADAPVSVLQVTIAKTIAVECDRPIDARGSLSLDDVQQIIGQLATINRPYQQPTN